VKEWIVRALTVRWARPAAALPLIEEFHRTDDEYMRWVIGNALETVADSSVAPQLIEIAGDSRYGASRQMVVVALGRVGGPDAMPLLLELLHDDEVAGHALIALGKVGDENARAAIQPFLEDANSWKRREARKALKAIDKRAGAVRPAR
jgi:HEAT repeat protein